MKNICKFIKNAILKSVYEITTLHWQFRPQMHSLYASLYIKIIFELLSILIL